MPDEKVKEIIEALSKTKSLEEFCEIAKNYGLPLEENSAKSLFTTLTNIIYDDELAKVAGGASYGKLIPIYDENGNVIYYAIDWS